MLIKNYTQLLMIFVLVSCLPFGVPQSVSVGFEVTGACDCNENECRFYWDWLQRNTDCRDNNGWPRVVCGMRGSVGLGVTALWDSGVELWIQCEYCPSDRPRTEIYPAGSYSVAQFECRSKMYTVTRIAPTGVCNYEACFVGFCASSSPNNPLIYIHCGGNR